MDELARLLELCALAGAAADRGRELQGAIAREHARICQTVSRRETPTEVAPAIPGGMLEALRIAGALGRDTRAVDHHYTRAMPELLVRQLVARGGPEEPLFSARLSLPRMPRLREALEGLFARVAGAGLSCQETLGAATPQGLLAARPTLGALYAGCHFGRSMPMLYASPADVAAFASQLATASRAERDPLAWIDARYAGPLAHELAHLNPIDPERVPAPGNLHEALAAWLGSEAFPAQLWPRAPRTLGAEDPGGLDALPGGACFASVGAWVARAVGEREAIRVQAGASSLDELLGGACASGLRLYGWLPHLETSAPHFLADTFAVERWWKLFDLHRDPALAEAFDEQLARPLLEAPPPPPGSRLVARWNGFLDALPLSALPAARDPISRQDEKLALRACRALLVRARREGGSFRAEQLAPPPWPKSSETWVENAADAVDANAAIYCSFPAVYCANPPKASEMSPKASESYAVYCMSATDHLGVAAPPLRLELERSELRASWPGPDAVGAPPRHPIPPNLSAAFLRAGLREVRAGADGLPPLPAPAGPSAPPTSGGPR